MPIDAGSQLGPYTIVSRIGAGGMGEVWRATDTRLDRSVAIKVLPETLAENEQFRARFEREAKTISSLNHPHICTLFDVGQHDGSHFLVMELIEGESLADRLAKGALPAEQVIRLGAEIAEALDRAHRQGVIHRDVKPGNVMLTKSGVKLLDFGLARAGVEASPIQGLTELPTQAKPLTQEGMILGTFQYMAPEQLEGQEADARTDIFALGALLYEMATGKRAFEGSSRTSLIAAIVSSQPTPISQVVPMTPPALDHVVRRCLEKDPQDRWQSAHDVASELRWISGAGSQAGVAAPLTHRRKSRERLAWIAAVALAMALAVTGYFALRRTDLPPRFYRTSLVLPSYLDYYSGPMAISPDGKSIAYAAESSTGQRILWVRRFDEAAPQPLPAAVDAASPFWSPDGQTLGYFTLRKMQRISASGGQPEAIADSAGAIGGSWNELGDILFTPDVISPIYRVSASGGDPVALTSIEKLGHRSHRWPSFLPDGKHFVFLALRAPGGEAPEGIYLGSLDSSEEPKFLMAADSNVVYVEPGRLIFSRGGILRSQRFDLARGVVSGEPTSIAPLQHSSRFSAAMFSAVPDAIVYQEKGTEVLSELQWVNRAGELLGTVGSPGYFWSPQLSGDAKRVAVDKSDSNGNGDIWILETTRSGATRFTLDESNESGPLWTPGADRLIYMINPDRTGMDILVRSVHTGSAAATLIGEPHLSEYPQDISPDGRHLLFGVEGISRPLPGGLDIHVWSMDEKTSKPYLSSGATEEGAQFSRDGNWVAYVSDESGRNEVYVQSFPALAAQWQISTSGGSNPRWSRDGRELFYVSADGRMMAVPVTTGERFEAGAATALFPVRLRLETSAQYDVDADGSRFLLNTLAPRADPPLTVMTGWQSRYDP